MDKALKIKADIYISLVEFESLNLTELPSLIPDVGDIEVVDLFEANPSENKQGFYLTISFEIPITEIMNINMQDIVATLKDTGQINLHKPKVITYDPKEIEY